ncbi:hypothetical protein [Staphylococcus aureus]
MIRRPPRSTRVRSSAASDVYKRQLFMYSTSDVKPAFFNSLVSSSTLKCSPII